MPSRMGELLPPMPSLGPITNANRLAAARAVADRFGEMPEDVLFFLGALGLIEERDGDFHAVNELGQYGGETWWAEFRRQAVA